MHGKQTIDHYERKKVNSEKYCKSLKCMLTFVNKKMNRDTMVLHDGAPYHTSMYTKENYKVTILLKILLIHQT